MVWGGGVWREVAICRRFLCSPADEVAYLRERLQTRLGTDWVLVGRTRTSRPSPFLTSAMRQIAPCSSSPKVGRHYDPQRQRSRAPRPSTAFGRTSDCPEGRDVAAQGGLAETNGEPGRLVPTARGVELGGALVEWSILPILRRHADMYLK